MDTAILGANVGFGGDLLRNIPSIREAQNLFDDLSSDPLDWDIAVAAEEAHHSVAPDPVITRPFLYGSVISYSFESANWQSTRFSDGSRYGVWYGSLDEKTTVYETAWHWYVFLGDSFPGEDREIVTERRVFNVRCDALLVDLRGRERDYPDLVSRRSYAFTHQVGAYAHEQGLNGFLVQSARCAGTNAAILREEQLSNVRHARYLSYRANPVRDTFAAEREPGRAWLSFRPSTLG